MRNFFLKSTAWIFAKFKKIIHLKISSFRFSKLNSNSNILNWKIMFWFFEIIWIFFFIWAVKKIEFFFFFKWTDWSLLFDFFLFFRTESSIKLNWINSTKMRLDEEAIQNFAVAKIFRENTDRINSLDFTADGLTLIASSDDDSIILYDCQTGT